MIYLKSYKYYKKLFETRKYSNIDFILDENEVEEYFMKNYNVSEESYRYIGSVIFQFVNKEKYIEDIIYDNINNLYLEDLNDDDIREYIKKCIYDDDINISTLNDYIIENIDSDLDKELFLEDKLEMLDTNDLYNYINTYLDDNDAIEFIVHKQYDNISLKDYLDEFCTSEEYYDYLVNYIDFKKLDKYIKEIETYDYMLEYYLNDVDNNEILQYRIFEYNHENIIYLFDLLSIGSYFGEVSEHQIIYIDECKKKHEKTTIYDTKQKKDEKWLDILDNCLKTIDEKFGFSDEFRKKYSTEIKKFLNRKKSKKYNL